MRGNLTKERNVTLEQIEGKIDLLTNRAKGNIPQVLKMRLEGYTLEAVANSLKLTRERIRQMEALGVEILRYDYVPAIKIQEPKEVIEYKKVWIFDKKLELTTRTVNALEQNSIRSIAGLIKKSEYQLLLIKGIGKKGVQMIKDELSKNGLSLHN